MVVAAVVLVLLWLSFIALLALLRPRGVGFREARRFVPDIVPDFIPVVGYADDVIVVALVLRSVVRRAGREKIERHWRGTPDGLVLLRLLAGLT